MKIPPSRIYVRVKVPHQALTRFWYEERGDDSDVEYRIVERKKKRAAEVEKRPAPEQS